MQQDAPSTASTGIVHLWTSTCALLLLPRIISSSSSSSFFKLALLQRSMELDLLSEITIWFISKFISNGEEKSSFCSFTFHQLSYRRETEHETTMNLGWACTQFARESRDLSAEAVSGQRGWKAECERSKRRSFIHWLAMNRPSVRS